ncbi:4-hydroxy-tetrahydrodipicolinate synthase [bioreactor metagenome]|uniref:4-hydroxy-tetrahydrodipicolinate synthase n=1 Tax=bioreactor metagenome TaxID=1076179 RepID=A0A645G0B4_9ZZZZ
MAPKIAHEIAISGINGDMKTCAKLQLEYLQLCSDLFMDVNPIPVKEAMNLMGMNVGKCRLPLVELSDSNREKLALTLKKYNLI